MAFVSGDCLTDVTVQGYDETVTHRALMLSSLLMASLAAGIGFLTSMKSLM